MGPKLVFPPNLVVKLVWSHVSFSRKNSHGVPFFFLPSQVFAQGAQ